MQDYYFQSNSYTELLDFSSNYVNVIGPKKGSEAIPESVDEEGNTNLAQPAIGDPNTWYVCIRINGELTNSC